MSLRFSSRVPNRGSRFGVMSSAFVLKLRKNLRGAPEGAVCLDAQGEEEGIALQGE